MSNQRQRRMFVRDKRIKIAAVGLLFAALLPLLLVPELRADAPPPLEPDDGSGRLTIGTLSEATLAENEPIELLFTADGAGMLTVAWGGELTSIQLQLLNDNDQMLNMDQGRQNASGNLPVRHAMIPIGKAGTYRLQVSSESAGTVMIGSAWMPFHAMQGAGTENPAPPIPEPQDMVQITPGQPQQPAVPRGSSDTTFLWLNHTAQTDGQLALLFNADRGDLTLSVFRAGNYANTVEYVDSDMNGDTANEGVVIDMRAGETYVIRVNDLSDRGTQTNLRSVWLDASPAVADVLTDDAPNADNAEASNEPDR